jgi:hypothetical protein
VEDDTVTRARRSGSGLGSSRVRSLSISRAAHHIPDRIEAPEPWGRAVLRLCEAKGSSGKGTVGKYVFPRPNGTWSGARKGADAMLRRGVGNSFPPHSYLTAGAAPADSFRVDVEADGVARTVGTVWRVEVSKRDSSGF